MTSLIPEAGREPMFRTNALLPVSYAPIPGGKRSGAATRLRIALSLASILPRQGFVVPVRMYMPKADQVRAAIRTKAFAVAADLSLTIRTRSVGEGLLIMCVTRILAPAPIDPLAYPLVDHMDSSHTGRGPRRSVEWQMIENTIRTLKPGAWFVIPDTMFEGVLLTSVQGTVRSIGRAIGHPVTVYGQGSEGSVVAVRAVAVALQSIERAEAALKP